MALKMPKCATIMRKWATKTLKVATCFQIFVAKKVVFLKPKQFYLHFPPVKKRQHFGFMKSTSACYSASNQNNVFQVQQHSKKTWSKYFGLWKHIFLWYQVACISPYIYEVTQCYALQHTAIILELKRMIPNIGELGSHLNIQWRDELVMV